MKKFLLLFIISSLIHSAKAQQCIDTAQIDNSVFCTPVYDPVCGCDNETYSNSCIAFYYGGVTTYVMGECSLQINCSASFIYSPDLSNSLIVNFSDLSIGNITDWFWDFGDSSSSTVQNPVHTFAAAGQYNVCLVVKDPVNSCSDTLCQTIIVSAPGNCFAIFSSVQDSVDPNTLFFTDNSIGNASNWLWNFGDGTISNAQNPAHTFQADGTYQVCLTITDSAQNCTDSTCSYVYAGFQSGCSAFYTSVPDSANPFLYNFFDYSMGNANTWSWNFGDGSTSALQNPVHIFPAAGVYQVCMTISDSSGNCTDSICDYIMVVDLPVCKANFTFTVSNIINTLVTFTDSSSGNPTSWFWDFGDGGTSTLKDPFHNYPDTGTYYVCLTTIDSITNCTDTYCSFLYLGTNPPVCTAVFSFYVLGNVVSFTDESSGMISNYSWNFGDGSNGSGPYPTHTFTDSGYFNVCLTIINIGTGCFNTYCDSVYIAPSPGGCSASFTYTVFGDSVEFTDASTGDPVSWSWDFGEFFSSPSNLQNPSHTFLPISFAYNTCLTITTGSGCYDTFCDSVTIVGLKEYINSDAEFQVYPNPGKGNFVLINQGGQNEFEGGRIEIYTVAGEKIYLSEIKGRNFEIDLSEKAQGLYFIHLSNDYKTVQKKLMIIR